MIVGGHCWGEVIRTQCSCPPVIHSVLNFALALDAFQFPFHHVSQVPSSPELGYKRVADTRGGWYYLILLCLCYFPCDVTMVWCIASCYLIPWHVELQIAFQERKFIGCMLSVPCSVGLCAWKQGVSVFRVCSCHRYLWAYLCIPADWTPAEAMWQLKGSNQIKGCVFACVRACSSNKFIDKHCSLSHRKTSWWAGVEQNSSVSLPSQCWVKSAVFLKKQNYCNLLRRKKWTVPFFPKH